MRAESFAEPSGLYALIHRRPIVPRLLVAVGMIFSLGLLWGRFHDLDLGDFVDWDESLYAWRAKVAVLDGAWLDQSHYTFNGFYSGAFPPLQVWQMAAMFQLFGFEEWAARFPSAVMGCLALLGIGWCGWILGGAGVGVLALLLLGIVSYFTRYSTMAQFDVPTVAWMVLTLATYLESIRSESRRRVWVYLCGACLGLGLMTKIALPALMFLVIVASQAIWLWLAGRSPGLEGDTAPDDCTTSSPLAAPPAIAPMLRRGQWRRYLADDIVIGGISAAVWLPWHVYMYVTHGQTFWDWYIGYHLLERHAEVLDAHVGGWWFYLHAAYYRLPPVMHGLGIAAALALAWLVVRALAGRRGAAERVRCLRAAAAAPVIVWLALVLFVLQSSTTQREVYMLMIYPAVALAVAWYVVDLARFAPRLAHQCLLVALILGTERFWHHRARADSIWMLLSGEMEPPSGATVAGEVTLLARGNLGLGLLLGALIPPALLGAAVLWRRLRGAAFDPRRVATLVVTVAVSLVALHGIGKDVRPAMMEAVVGARTDGWTRLGRWLNDRERYPRLVHAGHGIEAWPSYMYYLNGNISESRPSINEPVDRVWGLNLEALREYTRPGDAIIVERGLWSRDYEGEGDPLQPLGLRRVFESDRFLVYEPVATAAGGAPPAAAP